MSNKYKKTLKDLHLTERFLFAEAMEDPVIKRLERIRSNEEVGVRWMQEWEEKLKFKKEGIEEGLRIGREEARQAREEVREAREEGIRALLSTSFELGAAADVVSNKLMELFHLTEDEARDRISRYRKSV